MRPGGKVKATARREMSVACTLRAVLLMTLMPDADHREVLSTLLGDLVAVPWRRAHTVPSGTVFSTWRTAIGPAPLRELQRLALGAVVAEHRAAGPAAGAEVGGGLRLGALDGSVTRMPDTKANRGEFGTAGAVQAGYPQIRHLHATDAVTRATLAGDARHQHARPDPRQVRHPAARIGEFAPDGSYQAHLSGAGLTLTVRVIEYHITLDAATTPELFCLLTDLLDHVEHPAHLLADAYRWRWDGSETALREAKSTLDGAGPGTGAILRSTTPELLAQEHSAWILATELVHAATRSAAATAAPFRKGPRAGQTVHPRHLSFTTAHRTLITTVRSGTATASLPAPARAAAHRAALDVIATARVTTDRHRHRDHKIKSRQAFAHTPRGSTTRTAPATVHVCGATAA